MVRMPWLIRDDWDSQDAPDVYFIRPYLDLYANPSTRPRLFEYAEGGERYRMPYLESEIRAWLPQAGAGLKDMETAYGYGGPWSTSADPAFLAGAGRALEEACRERGIIAAFLRFHPLLGNEGLAPGFQVTPERETVCVDLEDADIWMNQISQKNRNMIRRAERDGAEVRIDPGFADLGGFRALYDETMGRLGAHGSYRFGDAYYAGLEQGLAGQGFVARCLYEGRLIAAALILARDGLAHYHLSGSLREYQRLAPNNLMLYRVILHLREKGYRRFHLGGGLSGDPDDPLFRFKLAFSPRTCRFHIGKRIFSPEEYARLRRLWSMARPEAAAVAGSRILFYKT
jgi:hypothetical protein